MKRFYLSCTHCHKRMIRFTEDSEQLFYICRNCGARCTFFHSRNARTDDWPPNIFDRAVREGVLSADGRVLLTGGNR